MANNILSLDAIDTLFADFVQSALNLNGDQVLISYQDKGQTSPKFKETVIYVHSSQEQDPVQQYKNRQSEWNSERGKFITSQYSMRRLTVSFSIYGVNCDELATLLKEIFYFDSTKQFLYKNNLSLIPSSITINSKVHEKINERWWERIDLEIGLYNSIKVEELVGNIESVKIDLFSDSDIHVIIGGEN